MAKELPFFKFEPNQWENGNIQICSREDKGLFMDLCSMYWSRLGDVPQKLAIQKLCAGNATALDSLIENSIIEVNDGKICIDFLNEQLSEFKSVSKVNSKNALLGWKKRRKDATALRPHCETDAIREEEIREEKKREEEKKGYGDFDELFLSAFDERTCETYTIAFKGIDLGAELQKFRIKCDNDSAKYYGRDVGGLRTAFQYQLQNVRKNGKQQTTIQDGRNQIRDILSKEFGNQGTAG